MNNNLEITETEKPSETGDLQPFLNYLQSPQGHEIATRLLSVVEDVKKSTLEKTTSHAVFEKWLQTGIIFVVVVAASSLSYLGKVDTSLGVLFRHPCRVHLRKEIDLGKLFIDRLNPSPKAVSHRENLV